MWSTDADSDVSWVFRRPIWPFRRTSPLPTANVAVPDSVAAEDGVYRSRAEVDGAVYDAMSNLGRNPSVGGTARRLETHIFGFSGALYGRMLRVELLEKIRDERRFASVEELRGQIARDKEYILGLK